MPCDATDDCPVAGKPGYDGALEPENIELAEVFKRYQRLGAWVLEHECKGYEPSQATELVFIMYEMELEHTRLKVQYPDVRLLWDHHAPIQG